MSMFQCEVCGCEENTARGVGVYYIQPRIFDWSYAPERKGKKVCSACGPLKYNDGTPTRHGGEWHGKFKRTYYPVGLFKTGPDGNLVHAIHGKVDRSEYALSDDLVRRAQENGVSVYSQWLSESILEHTPEGFHEQDFFHHWTAKPK